ncbi:phenylalanine--tRNA ligase subunit beta [Candidatus Pacearchaeota archaeon]|nr:phenylalanine--tRNA ligase subunit beta [Candidatus Pacearchaeota archaeon]
MAIITLDRKEFEAQLGRKITKEIEEKISLFGTPLESLTSEKIEIEIFPNRPDLLSLHGFLRGFKAFIGKEPGLKKYKINKSENKLYAERSLPKEWPYALACIVKGLKFDDAKIKEAIDIQEKLGATLLRNRKKGGIGLYPLEKIKFPVKFIGMNPEEIKFVPLEEDREMNGFQILSKHPTGKTYAHICKDWEKFPVFVDANGAIMSMPPIINSRTLGKIDETTTEVFLEATGTNLQTVQKALSIIVTALADMGGKIFSIECVQQNKEKNNAPDLIPEKMKISLENTNRLLGLNLKEKDLEKLFSKMGIEYKNKTALIPTWRADILHEVDLMEDIAIAYGYDKLEPTMPNVSTVGEESKESKIKRKISDILTGLGMLEVSSYHLIKESELQQKNNSIMVENSKTEYKILRPNLLIPVLRILRENKDQEYPQNIFEIGTVFSKGNEETGIKETTNLIILSSPANFTKMKQILNTLTQTLNIDYELSEAAHKQLIVGRTASIKVNNKLIGYVGEIHPETLRQWTIKMPCAVIEISLEDIFEKSYEFDELI